MYDCQSCGACCSHRWSWPILKKDRSDAINIPPNMVRDDYPLMKTTNGKCIALEGQVGCKVSCTIYENRPNACKSFKAGSDLCKEARSKAGLEV